MLRIAALDDECHVLERFEEVVKDIDDIQLCGLFEDHEDLIDYVKENPLDMVFLDIEMPEKSGLQLAEELRMLDSEIAVIFVTAYTQYAVEAFELSVVDYIVKPISRERLKKTLDRIRKNKSEASNIEKKAVINCFPRFECMINGEVLPLNHLLKAKELLAFLVSRKGAEASWDQITEALWPDADYKKAHNNLYATTYRLRKWLSENQINQIFESRRNSYRVVPTEFVCDYYELEKAWTDKDGNKMKLLYKGDFLEEDGYEWAYPLQGEWAIRMNRCV